MKLFNIESSLKEFGFSIDEVGDRDEHIYAHNEKVRIRFLLYEDKCEIGFQKTFDRWTNSADITHRYPFNFKSFCEIITGINDYTPCVEQPCNFWVLRSRAKACTFHVKRIE